MPSCIASIKYTRRMLTVDFLKRTLFRLKEFWSRDTQILEGSGYDGIISLLDELRSVEFPCVVLESGGTGTVQLVEGPVDTYTQSVWVMGQLGRGEDEAELYARMRELARKVAALLLAAGATDGAPEVAGLDWTRFTYMKRWGGQNARGYEIMFTFRENFSLLLDDSDLKPYDTDDDNPDSGL